MSTELARISEQNYVDFVKDDKDAVMALTGQSADNFSGNRSNLARLRVNYEAEVEVEVKGKSKLVSVPRGTFTISVPTTTEKGETTFENVYADKVELRPFMQTFEFSVFDPKENKPALATTQFQSWTDVILDTDGREKKANKYKKDVIASNASYSDKLKCSRLVYGTVTFIEGKNAKGDKVEVNNLPCVFRLKGSNFTPIGDTFESLTKKGRMLFNYPLTCSTRREKQGTNTYFVIEYEVSPTDVLFTEEDFELLKTFVEHVKVGNGMVRDNFNKQREEAQKNQSSKDLAADFDDEVPFD